MTVERSLSRCHVLEFPKIRDPRGNLTFVEGGRHLPFDIARVYYLYDVPGGESRAGHAHKSLQQVLIAIAGSFDVILDDGTTQARYQLNRPYIGLYICEMIWREISNFSSGAVCLALASAPFLEADYIRGYDDFRMAKGAP